MDKFHVGGLLKRTIEHPLKQGPTIARFSAIIALKVKGDVVSYAHAHAHARASYTRTCPYLRLTPNQEIALHSRRSRNTLQLEGKILFPFPGKLGSTSKRMFSTFEPKAGPQPSLPWIYTCV